MVPRRPGLALTSALAGVAVLVAAARFAATAPDSTGAFALASGAIQLCLILLAVALAALGREPLLERLGLRPARLSVVLTLCAAVGFVALSMAMHAVLELTALKSESALAEIEERVAGQRGAALSWLLLAVGLAPAVGEELLFRGALLRGLLRTQEVWSAIAISAAAFALVHIEPIHVAAALPLGLYLGCLGWLSGSVWPPLIAHALNNGTAVLVPAFAVRAEGAEWIILALGGAVAAVALAWVWRRAGAPPPIAPLPAAPGGADPPDPRGEGGDLG